MTLRFPTALLLSLLAFAAAPAAASASSTYDAWDQAAQEEAADHAIGVPSPTEVEQDDEEGGDPWWMGADEPATVETTPRPAKRRTPKPPKRPAPQRTTSGRAANVPYGALIASTARRNGLSVALFTALVWQESRYNARAKSPAGARGLTQLMPATARGLGVRNSFDPAQNLSGGARYLKAQLVRFRSTRLALAAYNAGPNAVARYGGVPPYAETQAYVRNITSFAARLRRMGVR